MADLLALLLSELGDVEQVAFPDGVTSSEILASLIGES